MSTLTEDEHGDQPRLPPAIRPPPPDFRELRRLATEALNVPADPGVPRSERDLVITAEDLIWLLDEAAAHLDRIRPETPERRSNVRTCEHGTPLTRLCEPCRAYLRSPEGQTELVAFGVDRGRQSHKEETCPTCGKRYNRQCDDGWHI